MAKVLVDILIMHSVNHTGIGLLITTVFGFLFFCSSVTGLENWETFNSTQGNLIFFLGGGLDFNSTTEMNFHPTIVFCLL